VSDRPESDPQESALRQAPSPEALGGATEEVDAVVVVQVPPASTVPARQQPRAVVPAMQAAAVAAGGFVAGAAVVGLVSRGRHRRDLIRAGSRRGVGRRGQRNGSRTVGELVQIVGSRSLLVDVHLLGGRD
jgi:hypothetical protein